MKNPFQPLPFQKEMMKRLATKAKEAKPSYVKTTGKSRRLAAQAKAAALMEASKDDPRKPAYVSRKATTLVRDSGRTKGRPYSRFGMIEMIPADMSIPGALGYVVLENRGNARMSSKRKPGPRRLVLNAVEAQHMIPAPFRAMMGLENLTQEA